MTRHAPPQAAPGPAAPTRDASSPITGLAARLAGFDIVSCDVFDTAVMRRLARPEDVLLLAGLRLHAAGLIACEAAAFVAMRLAAERHVRTAAEAAGSDEPRLADVYARLAACGVVGDAEAAARVEFDAECAACVAVPEVRDALAAVAARVVFVSDTMWPGAWIAALLEGCGYGGDCAVFTSADLGRSKHAGRLFPAVLEALGAAPGTVVHVGDNPLSDVARARAAGIAAIHLPWTPPPPEPEAVAALDPLVRLAHSRRRARAASASPDTGDIALGRYFSLMLIGFSLFVLAEARRRGVRRLYFLARDGWIPLALVRRMSKRAGRELDLFYLHVSRQSVVVPTLADDLGRLAGEMADSMQGQRLDGALAFLGIDAAETAPMLRAAGLDPAAPVRGRDAVRRLFEAEAPRIAARVRELRADALGYLAQAGFGTPGSRLVIDVGWRGTIQSALCRLAELPEDAVAGCYLGLWPEALRPGFGPANAAGYLFGFGHPKPLMDRVREGYILLELVLSAPHGTVLGYAAGADGAIAPVHAAEAEPGASIRHRAIAALEADCIAEFEALDALLGGAWPGAIDPASALFDLEGLLTRPTRDEVAAINRIPFIHGINGRHTTVAVNPVPWHEFIRRPRATLRRLEHAPWRAGAVRASLPQPLPGMSHADLRHRLERLLRLVRWPG